MDKKIRQRLQALPAGMAEALKQTLINEKALHTGEENWVCSEKTTRFLRQYAYADSGVVIDTKYIEEMISCL